MTHCTVVMHTETRTQQGVLSYVLLNVQGGVCAKADVLAPLIYHDIVCLTETWLIECTACSASFHIQARHKDSWLMYVILCPAALGPRCRSRAWCWAHQCKQMRSSPHCSPPLSSGSDALFTCKLISNAGQIEVLQMQKWCQNMQCITVDDDGNKLHIFCRGQLDCPWIQAKTYYASVHSCVLTNCRWSHCQESKQLVHHAAHWAWKTGGRVC